MLPWKELAENKTALPMGLSSHAKMPMLGLFQPMSSPQMTRMFGFFPEEGAGDCALTDALKTHISARLNAAKMSFVFMIVRMRLVEIASLTI